MRHELPTGKQEEDEHEQAKSEKDQAFVRHPPEGGTRRHRARRNGRAKRHKQERDEKRHPVVGSAPDDQRTDHQTHHYRGKRERDRVCCVIAWRQAHPLERPCLPRRELQGESAGRPSIGSLQQCYIHREAGEEDRQGEDDQRKPYTSGEQEPAPMQVCIGCIGTLPGFRWRILNAHLYDPCVTPWFVLLYASVDFHYMPGSLFPSIGPEVVFFSCSLFFSCNSRRRGIISNPFKSCTFRTWRGLAPIRLTNAAAQLPSGSGETKGEASPLHFQKASTGFDISCSSSLERCVCSWLSPLLDYHGQILNVGFSRNIMVTPHSHSPLTCWALRRTWGAISSRAL